MIKGKHTGQVLKSVRSSESSLCSDLKDLTVSIAEVPLASEVSLATKRRRKMSLQKAFMPKEKSSENILKSQPSKYSSGLQDRCSYLKVKALS